MAPIDKFARPGDLAGPAYNAAAVTPSDSTDLQFVTRGVYVGGSGDVKVNLAGDQGSGIVFKGVPAGATLPIAVTRILATGTSATNLVAIW